FNIFYPDLIDKSKAPTYKIVKEPGNDDTVLLWFTAGPPYEDIAFRIVPTLIVQSILSEGSAAASIVVVFHFGSTLDETFTANNRFLAEPQRYNSSKQAELVNI
ncbi:hypothetical protein FRC03_012027, partial [Tulasnella sp. 419]